MTLQRDLDKIIELRPEHVSTYHLIYEPQILHFFQQLQNGHIQELPEELSLKMSHTVVERLTEADMSTTRSQPSLPGSTATIHPTGREHPMWGLDHLHTAISIPGAHQIPQISGV